MLKSQILHFKYMWMGMDLEKHVEPGMEAIRSFENSRRTFLNSLVYNNWSTRCQSPSWPIQCGSRNSLVIWVFVPTAQAENELHSKDLQSSVAGLISMSEQNTSDSSEPENNVCQLGTYTVQRIQLKSNVSFWTSDHIFSGHLSPDHWSRGAKTLKEGFQKFQWETWVGWSS